MYRVQVKLASAESGGRAEFVAKCLPESGSREVEVYRVLELSSAAAFVPRLLGIDRANTEDVYLFLEWIPARRRWPWWDQNATLAVVRCLTKLHSLPLATFNRIVCNSCFESEIQQSAALTFEAYDRAIFGQGHDLRSMGRAIQRIADDMISIRQHLLQETGTVPLHGDVHSGNALIRGCGRPFDAVLLDWGRARLGSPLEDVSSWLQSLGYWEPEVRKYHDTLLVRYLQLANLPSRLIRRFRRLYWLAAGSNAMAGALRYHLEMMLNPSVSPRIREVSRAIAGDWLRIIRRADEYWRLGDEPGRQTAQLQTDFHQSAVL